jgi:hypothetical protein
MPVPSPPPQEYARIILIVIFIFYLYTSPDQVQPGFGRPHDYVADRIERARHSLDVLNRTKWQDFSPATPNKSRFEAARYLNLTGFREDDGYAWDRLDAFKKRTSVFSDQAKGKWRVGKDYASLEGEIYNNVTGIVSGRWIRYSGDLPEKEIHRGLNLSEIAPDIDWAFRNEDYWTRNVTGTEGKLMLRIDERNVEALNSAGDTLQTTGDDQRSGGLVREVAATMTVQDESSNGDGWEMRVHGVHWPRQGVLLMTTTSDKFAGIFGLPHFTTSQNYFTTSQKILNITLEKTVERMENAVWIDPSNPWSSSPDAQGDAIMPTPHCEYVVFVQVHPLEVDFALNDALDPTTMIHQIEEELRFPNGVPIPYTPKLQMSAVILSPDCGFMLESKGPPDFSPADRVHLMGKKQEEFLHNIHDWMLVLASVVFGQILLLKVQSKEASTPSTIGRVSLYTIAMMLMTDALLFSSLSLLSATAPNIFPSALLASFASLMSVALGVRFIGAIYNVQEPERRERIRAQIAAQAAVAPPGLPTARPIRTTPIITAAGVDINLTQPATSPGIVTTNEQPVIIPSDQDIDGEIAENITVGASAMPISSTRGPLLPVTNPAITTQPIPRSASFGAIYLQFVIAITLIMFLSLSATTWPIPIRTAYVHIMSFIYLSFWVPQIRRNIIRNCRKALLWKFIIGQSMFRLLPFAYFYLKEDNILFAETDWTAFAFLAGWVWIQLWILVAQEILGPRWGLPKGWTEEGWDYHPILKEDNVESGGLPIGLVQAPSSPTFERTGTGTSEDLGSSKKSGGGARSVDCAICMQILEVPVIVSGSDGGSSGSASGVVGILARRQYMVTPCRHIFHSPCLEGWMRFRLQCPICRENLPPL